MIIEFKYENVRFRLKGIRKIRHWLTSVVSAHNKNIERLQFTFITDDGLLVINQRFLRHDYYTDIITFDYCEADLISGEIYISVDRVKDNSISLNLDFNLELLRVMAHGVLHLVGFKDRTPAQRIKMRGAEDKAISLWVDLLLSNK